MNRLFLCFFVVPLLAGICGYAEGPSLPYDPERIRRLSLDGVPRSLSIRQGEAVWLGYDLELAAVTKVWRAPDGESGLVVSDFTTRSAGETLSKASGKESWRWSRGGEVHKPAIRYLGCSQREGHFLLSWELKLGDQVLTLLERVAFEGDADAVVRELAVEGLPDGEALLAPGLGEGWDPAKAALSGSEWHRFVLRQ